MAQNVSNENRLLAALAYPIWIIALVIVVTDMKKDPFMRHHGWTALFWGIAWTVLWFALQIFLHVPFHHGEVRSWIERHLILIFNDAARLDIRKAERFLVDFDAPGLDDHFVVDFSGKVYDRTAGKNGSRAHVSHAFHTS